VNQLSNSDHFNTAFLQQLPVEVWQDGEKINAGIIERHIKDAVKINGMYYVKSQNEFRVR